MTEVVDERYGRRKGSNPQKGGNCLEFFGLYYIHSAPRKGGNLREFSACGMS